MKNSSIDQSITTGIRRLVILIQHQKKKRMDGRRGYICGEKDDDSFDIMDYLAVTYPKCGVYDEEDETAKMYESVLELIQEKVKSLIL